MKKILAILLALAVVGVAFAQDAAPAAPVVTYGLTSSFGFDAIQANTALSLNADGKRVDAFSPLIGFDFAGGQLFKIEPWAQAVVGPLTIKGTVGYKASQYNSAAAYESANTEDQLVTLNATYAKDGLTLYNTFGMNKNNYGDSSSNYGFPGSIWAGGTSAGGYAVYNQFGIAVVKDNLEGAVDFATDMSGAGHFTLYGDLFYTLDKKGLYDWYFKVSKLFDIWNVTIGGQDNNYSSNFRPYGLYPSTSVINYATTARTGTGLFFSGDDLSIIPVYNEFDLSAILPLYVQVGLKVPTQTYALTVSGDGVSLENYIRGSNIWLAAKYTMADVGDFQIGAIPNFGMDQPNLGSTYFGDFNIKAVPNLTSRVSFDLGTMKKVDYSAKAAYYDTMVVNFGAEGKYDLKDALPGLVAYVGIYDGIGIGQTTLQKTGTAWAAATGAQFFTADYTEANVNGVNLGAKPLMIALRGTYTMESKDVLYLESLFVNNNALKTTGIVTTGATLAASGYYSYDKITVSYTKMAGVGKLAIAPFYTLFLGVPTATNLGISDVEQAAAYNESVADKYNPWGVALTFTAPF